ncbi:MAG: hypothetical protein QNJ75_10790 [Acidimicrobiia bacterium]|nr:hypothetical protein [Acidimicrobiia bacterium]
MTTESVPVRSVEDLLAESPGSRRESIDGLWRSGGSTTGPVSLLVDVEQRNRLDLLETIRVVAMSETRRPDVVAQALEIASPSPVGDDAALHSAASFVLTRPEIMRWVSANAAEVAASPNWKAALPGLGGVVVSVPLAEEALGHVIAAKARMPSELTRFVQLNPWFSHRFAVKYRRHAGGKRIRFQDRAATARAWSHARSLLRSKIPSQWHSPHGRGGGRGLDEWSHRFLVRYTGLVVRAYRDEGIPPTMAALLAIASAVDGANPPTADSLSGWRVLPAGIEQDALNLMGIGPAPVAGLTPAAPKDTGIFPLKASRGMIPRISWR